MNKFTTVTDAINHIADVLNLSMAGSEWVYENSDCPRWDDAAFAKYDFLADSNIDNIPAEYV